MADTAERIKFELLSEYDRTGKLDITTWVNRYPAYRDEIIDFWLWARGTRVSPEERAGPFDSIDADITEESLRNACLAVNFGPQWLSAAVEPDAIDVDKLGTELESIRQKPVQKSKAPVAFQKAVVYTWVVSRLQKKRPSVSRLAVQKTTYLLEWALDLGIFVEHGRKPLGPYDYKARYKDAEPIAVKKGWLTLTGANLRAADDLSEVDRSAGRYVKSAKLADQLLDCLSDYSDSQLETLATVHWTIRELGGGDRDLSIDVIERALASTPEWRDKLSRANFSPGRLHEAVAFLQRLRLIAKP
ncbi:MAG: hypothetical protein M3P26_06680 [Gemmatimonadota bacterium]|nr:hypothetical protein [Gemmatimonadota bacterium]